MPTVNDDYPKRNVMTDEEMKAAAIAQFEAKQHTAAIAAHNFPTEIIELPSKGIPYPAEHPLKSGTIEMKYMSAKEEDILTNQSFIKQGVVLDKLFKSLIVTPVSYEDLLVGDKNAIMVASRILGYGKLYETKITTPSGNEQTINVDLTTLTDKTINFDLLKDGEMCYNFELPLSKRNIKVTLITQAIQNKIEAEIKGLAKVKKDATATTTLKYIIKEIDGNDDVSYIRKFIDSELLAIESRAIRNFLKSITPDIELRVDAIDEETQEPFRTTVAIGLDFFWPDIEL
jgi:hypothetical protein